MVLAGWLLTACGGNCAESVRLGDFERSQGNMENALRHYEQALAQDPKCTGVDARIQETREFLESRQGGESSSLPDE